ncbi:MAG: hypothetical protein RSA20_06840 [Oscillospiraceae bacterium]
MKELLKKIMENAKKQNDVDLTEQGIREAAKRLGYTDAEIETLFSNFDGFPLDEDDLDVVTGGRTSPKSSKRNKSSAANMH